MTVLEHITAVKAAMEGAGLRVWVSKVDDPKPLFPYVLIWPNAGYERSDVLCNELGELEFHLGVTCAGLTTESVLIINQRTRAILRAPIAVPGWIVNEPSVVNSMPLSVDASVTLDVDGNHPLYSVDRWLVTSQKTHEHTSINL